MVKPVGVKDQKRKGNRPWKHIFGVDRKFTARVERAVKRGQSTPPKESV